MTSILPTYVVTENYFHLYFRCFVREMFQGGLIWIKAVSVWIGKDVWNLNKTLHHGLLFYESTSYLL